MRMESSSYSSYKKKIKREKHKLKDKSEQSLLLECRNSYRKWSELEKYVKH